jgi:DNA-binding CsgD family transcriptional regulator/PAS domain-containing protein
MSSESDLASLIAAIYEAGMDFSLWPYALGRIASAFGVSSASMARQGRTASECWGFAVGIDPIIPENYLKYYHGVDPLWQSTSSAPAGTVQTDTMVIPRRELVRTEFFNDFLLPQGVEGLLNAVVLVEDGRQSIVTLHGDQQFDESHVALYKLLAPHLQRAVQINIKLASAELNHMASVETLNRLEEGVLFVDLNAKIVFANKAAEKLFADRDLRLNKGRLHASSAAETATLHAVIAKCAATRNELQQSGFVSLGRQPGRSPLSLLVAPLPMETSSGLVAPQPMAVIFVNDPDKSNKPAAVQLRKKFGMTPAEAAFAVEILTGDGIQAAADRLSISRATARTHLSRIFDKTGTRRQAELVRVLLSTKNIIL